jgi:L-asparagine transporter-like permease
MPRWLALITIAVALVLLFVTTASWWVILVFPAWVLLVSGYILAAHFRGQTADRGAVPSRSDGATS